MFVHRPTVERDPDLRYLWWLSAPMFGVFLAFSVKTGGGEVNWPVTAYLSGLVLTAAWLMRRFQSPRTWYRRTELGHADPDLHDRHRPFRGRTPRGPDLSRAHETDR